MHTVLAVDTVDTASAVNLALGYAGDKALSPELIGHILQAHLKAAADLQEAADAVRLAEHTAMHTARLDEARQAASADRDARFAARQRAHQDAEEKQEVEELNGHSLSSRASKARARSRTPLAEQEEPPAPPLPPQQPKTGSATIVACAVVVKTKADKNAEKKRAKKAAKEAAKK